MRKIVAVVWIILLIGTIGSVSKQVKADDEHPTLCNSLMCIQFENPPSNMGGYTGKLNIFKVDIDYNGNPKDDPNLFFGDLRGWQALRLTYQDCWARVDGDYDITSDRIIFTRTNTDAGIKERVEYTLDPSKTVFYIKPTVTILGPRENDIRYGLTFISDIYVTSDPGETIYVKGFGVDDKYIDSNDPQTVYNWAKQEGFEATIEEGKFTSGYVTSIIVSNVHLVYMKIERPGIGTYYLGIVSKEPKYASIDTASSWAHNKGIYLYLGTPNEQLNTGETLNGEFTFVYAKTREELLDIANSITNSGRISYPSINLSRGLVAYYSFDHCDARDDSGNGHDGEIYGNPKCVDGVVGKAFEFDGARIALNSNLIVGNRDSTLSVFLKPMSFMDDPWGNAIYVEQNSGEFAKYDLLVINRELRLFIRTGAKSGEHSISIIPIEVGKWYHVVIVKHGLTLKFYVNGKFIKSYTLPSEIYDDVDPKYTFIGGQTNNKETQFKGLIDEVRIYNRALSEDEVKALYEQGVSKVSPQPTQPKTVEYLPKEDLSKWKYYREVTIKEQSGETLENFQVLIKLNSNNFDFSKANPDSSDIRIVDENGNFLPYWIEEWNLMAKRAKIWTIIPRIPANGEVKLRLYYGNPNAQSRSDGDKVFEFFDDFNGNQLDTSKWKIIKGDNEEQYVSNGFYYYHSPASYDSGGGIITKTPFTSKGTVVIQTRAYFGHGWDGVVNLLAFSSDSGGIPIYDTRDFSRNVPHVYLIEHNWGSYDGLEIITRNGKSPEIQKIAPLSQGKWNIYEWALDFTNKKSIYVRRNSELYPSEISLSTVQQSYYYILLGYGRGIETKVDYILIRKYAPKDPIAIVGSEVNTSGGALTTPTNTQTSTPTQTQTATTTQTSTPTSTLAPVASSAIDTAKGILSKIPSSVDIGDAKTMLDEAQKAYNNGDYELAKKFAETAQALAVKSYYDKLKADVQVKESEGYDTGEVTKLLQQAYDAYNRKDYTKALELLTRADLALQAVVPVKKPNYVLYGALALALFGVVVILMRSQKSKKEKLKAEFTSLINSGDNIVQKDQFGALEYYSKAFQIAKKLGDSKLIGRAQEKLNTVRGTVIAEISSLITRGNEALDKSDYDKALAYYKQALKLAEKLNDAEKIREAKKKMDSVNKVRKIRELLSEGDVLVEQEKYSQALSRYKEALEIAREVGDSYLVELLKGRVSKANEMIEKINKEVSSLVSQASQELMEENYEGAIEKLSQALVLAEKIGGTVSIENIKTKLEEAKKRKELRDNLKEAKSAKDYSQALELLGEALTLAEELGDERMVAQIRDEIEEVRRAQILETLKDGVNLVLPKEIPYGREITLSINVENRLNETIENLTVDFSELSPYFTLGEERITFPPIRPGRKLGKDIIIKPQFKGDFDFNVKISSNLGETVKTLKVKVDDYYAPAQFTPKPLTPKSAPEELEAFYENFQYIGEGGFARVFKAKRKKDGRIVAVKIPKTLDPATGKAFVREISNWLHLKHPNIVELYDVNVIPIPYLEMEYCEGSLAKLGKPMDIEQAAHIIFNVAEGLKYAHSKKIVHRDLKPSNILLKAGIPKISDWGLSKVMSESRSSTLSSFTPYYAAPEQLSPRRFGHTDERTDIWQLGVLFYELVTGKLPFEGRDLGEVTFAIINENPVLPSKINPEAKIVEPIIMRMLEKDKGKRYQSVEELQKDLARILNMTYVEGLRKSKDLKRTIFYIGDLALINLKTGNLKEALKYLLELREYAGKYQKDLDWLIEQVRIAMDEGITLGEEAVMKADVIVHQIKMGR